MRHSATLCPNWGDGSGTSGTLSLPDQPLRMWQGQWDPIVYCFSYWKELKTLLLTMAMELIKLKGGADGCGTTVFYLTDKSTTYWIAQAGHSSSPCLHRLIWQIQCLELEFGIHLQVVHVPCVVMISQGSDALSHGVWVTPFQSIQDQCTIYCFCLCTCRTGSSSHRVLYQAMVSSPPSYCHSIGQRMGWFGYLRSIHRLVPSVGACPSGCHLCPWNMG